MRKLLFLLLCLTSPLFGGVVEDGIKQLSWHDRACMKAFFDEVIKRDQISHVLFYDNKPVCLTALVLKDKHQIFRNIQCLKGWRTFKKYEHLFPHPDYIIDENVIEFDKNFRVLHVYFINKRSLVQCLETNLDLFKESLGLNFSTESFMAKLEEGCSLPDLLFRNEMLIGVLLGYGQESARAFHEACLHQNRNYAPPETETYRAVELKSPKGCKIYPVVFMGNPHSPEVKKLSSIYERELEAFWQAYRPSNNRLRLVLKGLCSDSSPD
ncbi:MAG: hypothetical protein K940chlam9_00481 [Chlamydiae bacterium]|nr:hypothetical protein [Chlamydiota bacterium]